MWSLCKKYLKQDTMPEPLPSAYPNIRMSRKKRTNRKTLTRSFPTFGAISLFRTSASAIPKTGC